jgi:hypothetical protein
MAKHKPWSEEDDRYIKENYSRLPVTQVAKDLGRHPSAIKRRAARLQVNHKVSWTEGERRFIEKNLPLEGFDYCERSMKRSAEAIRMYARKHNIPMPNPRSDYWTAEEDEILVNHIQTHTYYQISLMVGRTQEATRKRYQKLRDDAELLGFPFPKKG